MAAELTNIDFSLFGVEDVDPIKKCFYQFKKKYCQSGDCIDNIVNGILKSKQDLTNTIFMVYLIDMKDKFGVDYIDFFENMKINGINKNKYVANIGANANNNKKLLTNTQIKKKINRIKLGIVDKKLKQYKKQALEFNDPQNFIIWICTWNNHIAKLYNEIAKVSVNKKQFEGINNKYEYVLEFGKIMGNKNVNSDVKKDITNQLDKFNRAQSIIKDIM